MLTDFINGLYLAQEPTVLIRNDTVARLGNVLTETDANSNVTNQTYDGLNRRTRTTDSLGTIMEAGYDKGAFNSPLHHG